MLSTMPLSCPCLAPLCFGALACLLGGAKCELHENLGAYYFYSPSKEDDFDPDFIGPAPRRCCEPAVFFSFFGKSTGRMPNPQSNNHQSRDGSGSGDRGRTFRPIEVSHGAVAFVGRRAVGSASSPSLQPDSIFLNKLYPRNHRGGPTCSSICLEW